MFTTYAISAYKWFCSYACYPCYNENVYIKQNNYNAIKGGKWDIEICGWHSAAGVWWLGLL